MPHALLRSGLLFLVPLALVSGAWSSSAREIPDQASQIDQIRQIERERLASLVAVDLATARRLHADDFQLINPVGVAISKTEYLSQLESGQLDYRAWEAGEIAVRLYGDAAVIRYQDVRFDVDWEGRAVNRNPMYHTNLYQRRGGQWQVVWSQASGALRP